MNRTYLVYFKNTSGTSLRNILIKYLDQVQMLDLKENRSSVYMSDVLADRMRQAHPELVVEADSNHALTGG